MSSPYRDEGVPAGEVETTGEPQPLASFDVSGAKGSDGVNGRPGSSGQATGYSGGNGQDGGPSQAGENAGQIRLELIADDAAGAVKLGGELFTPHGQKQPIRNLIVIDETGFIPLRAIGGDGGRGGSGGRGGDGARGSDGSDATRWSTGGDGGSGGAAAVAETPRVARPAVKAVRSWSRSARTTPRCSC